MSAALEPPFGARDPAGMAARIAGAADQVAEGLAALAREPWSLPGGDPAFLAVGAMGGSAIAADLVRAVEEPGLPRPIGVIRDGQWPAWVTREGRALLCSYSGNTEETLALYDEAGARGVPRIVLTSGGTLAERSRRDGVPFRTLPGGSPPRAALYSAWVRVSHLMHALGWTPDPGAAWREAESVLRSLGARLEPAVPEDGNPAKRLARSLQGRFVMIYTRTRGLAPLALRWRQQIEENAKQLAHDATLPELNHNEIVGWERTGWLHARAAVVMLRDDAESPEETARLDLTAEFVRARGAVVHEVRPSGAAPIARAASFSLWADWVSFYLALLEGADPTAIPSIDEFKRRLGARPGA